LIGTAVVITDAEFGQLGGDGYFNRCYAGAGNFLGCPLGTVIVGNTFNDNPAHGIDLDASRDAFVVGNTAFGNGFGTQTGYGETPPYTDGMDINTDPPCDHNTWLDNNLGTVNQPCVHHHVPGGPSPAVAGASAASATRARPSQPPRPGGRRTL
jgi:parallel beta-helix repeat protein